MAVQRNSDKPTGIGPSFGHERQKTARFVPTGAKVLLLALFAEHDLLCAVL